MEVASYAVWGFAIFFAGAWTLGLVFRPDQRIKATVVTVAFWWVELLLSAFGLFSNFHLLWIMPVTLIVPGAVQGAWLRRSLAHPSTFHVLTLSSAILVPAIGALCYAAEGSAMSAIVWVLLAVMLLLFVGFGLRYVLAFAVPQRVSGAVLLRQELKQRGIPYDNFPPEFFTECVAWAENVSSFTGHGSAVKRKAEFVESIVTLADMVHLWRTEPDSPMFATHGNQSSTYRTLFEKYDLRRAL